MIRIMPVYEYVCLSCKKGFERKIAYEEYGQTTIRCIHCGGLDVRRRINRVRVKKGSDSHLMEMAGPNDMAGIDNDPQEFGRMIRKLSHETGENLGPEFDEVVDRLEHGQTPEDIERELPEPPDRDDQAEGDI